MIMNMKVLVLSGVVSLGWLGGVASQCSEDEHHPENGGYFLIGAAGLSNQTNLDVSHGQKLPDNTWAPGRYYPYGEKNEDDEEQFYGTHTCSILSFCPVNDATEAVYELPDFDATEKCDFSSAVSLGEMNGEASDDDGCFRYAFEEDHELREYFFASEEGCERGQRLAVKIQDFAMTADQCIKIGLTTPRIRQCDCRLQKNPSTLGEPCRTAFSDSCQASVIETDECCEAGTCLSIYEDYGHPEGKAKEDERVEQCDDDMPGLCYNEDGLGTDTNRAGSTNCCSMTCSECGIRTKYTAQWKPCEGMNVDNMTASCGFLSRYDQAPFVCDFSKCAAGDHWHTDGSALKTAFGIKDEPDKGEPDKGEPDKGEPETSSGWMATGSFAAVTFGAALSLVTFVLA